MPWTKTSHWQELWGSAEAKGALAPGTAGNFPHPGEGDVFREDTGGLSVSYGTKDTVHLTFDLTL